MWICCLLLFFSALIGNFCLLNWEFDDPSNFICTNLFANYNQKPPYALQYFVHSGQFLLDARLITSTRIQFTFCRGWLFVICRAAWRTRSLGSFTIISLFRAHFILHQLINGWQGVFIRRHEDRPCMCGGSIFFAAKQPSVSPCNLGRGHCLNFFHKFGTP